ncbi:MULTISPECIES: proline iminopeptidase-family hydrolase [unclassified Paenibacillus]|uniref:proline iminopeptidase-family hydrolase n=1 Tax=unclassified Paenibacillus TaxID=185978 RepID=UPI00020D7BCD|nr:MULTISPECIES: proline iminopeptidase-family hydrolase [unclassified Paenibacillus]EGL17909.1 prolyl aminopeptidase [Paenibacillus sp. HGF7]EPD81594.1 proline-specific peptidase [Paenibacillus sp. HGH0039]
MRHTEGYIEVPGGKVWYSSAGEGGGTPLLVLHGGPGNTHDPLKATLHVLGDERPVIFYDQLGGGNSDRPGDASLWRTERFIEELACVREALGLDEVHILGHSWGTMLAASYLIERKPTGVRSVIFSSPCLSAARWKEDADRFLAELPDEVQAVIARSEEQGTTNSDEYRDAMKDYYKRHVCRIDPLPAVVLESRGKANKDIYMSMWGPSEFCPTGSLKTYDVTPRLHEINVPSLFLCGRYDEAAPESTFYYHSLVPQSDFQVLENSSHAGYLEEPEEYVRIVRGFLTS